MEHAPLLVFRSLITNEVGHTRFFINRNVVEFHIDHNIENSTEKMHFTIVYKRDIGMQKAQIKDAIAKIWPLVLNDALRLLLLPQLQCVP
jgi:hypothetical protein